MPSIHTLRISGDVRDKFSGVAYALATNTAGDRFLRKITNLTYDGSKTRITVDGASFSTTITDVQPASRDDEDGLGFDGSFVVIGISGSDLTVPGTEAASYFQVGDTVAVWDDTTLRTFTVQSIAQGGGNTILTMTSSVAAVTGYATLSKANDTNAGDFATLYR